MRYMLNSLMKTNRSFESIAEKWGYAHWYVQIRVKLKSIDRLKESFGAEELIFFFIPFLVNYSKCAAQIFVSQKDLGPEEDRLVPMLALGMVERVAYCLRIKEQFMEERTEYILIYTLLVEVQVKTQFYETDNTIAYSWPGVRDEKFKVRV